MTRRSEISYKFIESAPDFLEDGVVYVSFRFATAMHKCCCGCGYEVATPLSPAGWRVTWDGRSVSLYPSIGNWGLPCRSHYWIENNKIVWAAKWSEKQIASARRRDARANEQLFAQDTDTIASALDEHDLPNREKKGLLVWLKRLLG
jgi:Family of unknown function (DUF6527)